MGNCIFCEEPAGFLKKLHKECKQRHEQGKTEIVAIVGKVGSEGGDLKRLENSIEQVAASSHINEGDNEGAGGFRLGKGGGCSV